MATLILGTVGRAVGGPIGGLVGSFLGGAIDRGLFGGGSGGGRSRLADLAVQSSAYGEPLPRVYGRMRVAGNLVWTAGIAESSQRSGGGKIGPSSTSYSYSSSFAVIVAARPIVAIGRIWADGKLLRAADGTLNFPAVFRIYSGAEAQTVDPLIAAAEGLGRTPAYRGRAYVVFEDLPLADYGNRIPNLTFEVIADISPIGIDAIAADLSGGMVASSGGFPAVAGYAATQAGTIRQALTTLGGIADLTLADDGVTLRIGNGQEVAAIADDDLGVTDTALPVAQRHEIRDADTAVPDAIWMAYADLARDYQTGIQAATRRTPVLRLDQRSLTVAADAGDVKSLAEAALRRAIAARSTARFSLPWRYGALRPGALVATDGDPHPWRVAKRTITGALVEVEVERIASPTPSTTAAADAGRVYVGLDAPSGPTVLHVLDLPALPGAVPTSPHLLLAAAGKSTGWRRADVMLSRDGGASYMVAASIGAPATVGITVGTLSPGSSSRWDRRSTVDVELLSDTADLQSATEAAVLAGANLASVGNEIIQFASVVALGDRRFRLSTLLRGRRGSEAAIYGHAAGERFVLLDDRVTALAIPAEAVGAPLTFKAVGPGENLATVPAQTFVPLGADIRPLSPATVSVAIVGGDRIVSWRRRSRAGFAWTDGTDVPIGEESERYRVTVRGNGTVLRQSDVTSPSWTYSAADFAAEEARGSMTIEVAQISAVVGAGAATTVPA